MLRLQRRIEQQGSDSWRGVTGLGRRESPGSLCAMAVNRTWTAPIADLPRIARLSVRGSQARTSATSDARNATPPLTGRNDVAEARHVTDRLSRQVCGPPERGPGTANQEEAAQAPTTHYHDRAWASSLRKTKRGVA